jgi:hypothetical protein
MKFVMDVMLSVTSEDSNYLYSVIPTERLEVARCDGDKTIEHATLRIQPNLP